MKKKRVIYNFFSLRRHADIASYLEMHYSWYPVYWNDVSGDLQINEIRTKFGELVVHNSFDSRRGIPPLEMKNTHLKVVDDVLLRSMSQYESTIMKLIGRYDLDGRQFSYDERVSYYHYQLRYWETVIDRFKPDIFASWVIPHGAADFILYALCKLRGITTLMLNNTKIMNKYYLINSDLSNHTLEIEKAHSDPQISSGDMSPEIMKSIELLRSDYSAAIPDYMVQQRRVSNIPLYKVILKEIRTISGLACRNQILSQSYRKEKINYHPYNTIKSDSKKIFELFYSYRRRLKIRNLKSLYEKLSKPVDLSLPYIYFAANYQPERTTLPDAGVYNEIILCIEMLDSLIPEGWTLLFKEHPTTFNAMSEGDLYRTQEFYNRLNSLKKVSLVPLNIDSFSLIDGSQAVATATGTVGWEAMIRGRPTIVFGENWYKACPGVFRVASTNDCREAIDSIVSGAEPVEEKILSYCKVVQSVAYDNLHIRDYNKVINDDSKAEQCIVNIAEALHTAYRKVSTT